jgi:hypothetical protein
MSTSTPNLNANQILVPSRIALWLGPVGTPFPTDATTAPNVAFKHAGHTTEDSLSFETSPEFDSLRSAQADYPVLDFQTADGASIQIDMQQWNASNIKAAYGGGTVEELAGATGTYKFTPPAIGARKELAAIVDVSMGSKHYRFCYLRTSQNEGVSLGVNKGAASVLPLRLNVLGGDEAEPWYMLTDDPAFATA